MTSQGRSRLNPICVGDLVRIHVPPSGAENVMCGVVLEVWPSNLYEHSESVVLVGGYPDPVSITLRTQYLSPLESP
jgi:hypothetical protein